MGPPVPITARVQSTPQCSGDYMLPHKSWGQGRALGFRLVTPHAYPRRSHPPACKRVSSDGTVAQPVPTGGAHSSIQVVYPYRHPLAVAGEVTIRARNLQPAYTVVCICKAHLGVNVRAHPVCKLNVSLPTLPTRHVPPVRGVLLGGPASAGAPWRPAASAGAPWRPAASAGAPWCPRALHIALGTLGGGAPCSITGGGKRHPPWDRIPGRVLVCEFSSPGRTAASWFLLSERKLCLSPKGSWTAVETIRKCGVTLRSVGTKAELAFAQQKTTGSRASRAAKLACLGQAGMDVKNNLAALLKGVSLNPKVPAHINPDDVLPLVETINLPELTLGIAQPSFMN
eukprot:723363-Prorocentrum_minimum.AAC.1